MKKAGIRLEEIEGEDEEVYTWPMTSGLACWYCAGTTLVSLGFTNRAPYKGRRGWQHREKFLCLSCLKNTVRVIRVARRKEIGRVTFRREKGEMLVVPVVPVKNARAIDKLEPEPVPEPESVHPKSEWWEEEFG